MAVIEEVQQADVSESQFVARVGQLPIVTSTVQRLLNVYKGTKQSNRLLKYILETTETGVKSVARTSLPLVATPVNKLDEIACGQLDKLEQKYIMINKAAEQLLASGKSLYEDNVKPTVDTLVAVKDFGVNTVTGVKQYGFDKINGVKELGVNTVTSVKYYSVDKVSGVMHIPYGRQVSSGLNHVLEITESYIDYYLPEEQERAEKDRDTDAEVGSVMRIVSITYKLPFRVYIRAMRQLKTVQLRTRESLGRLSFTVHLIQHAQNNLGEVAVAAVPTRLRLVWEQINMDAEQLEALHQSAHGKPHVTTTTFECRAIATVRLMTLKLKRGAASQSASLTALPAAMRKRVSNIKSYTEELCTSLSTAENFKDLPSLLLGQTHEKATYIQENLDFLIDYMQSSRLASWRKSPVSPEMEACSRTERTSQKAQRKEVQRMAASEAGVEAGEEDEQICAAEVSQVKVVDEYLPSSEEECYMSSSEDKEVVEGEKEEEERSECYLSSSDGKKRKEEEEELEEEQSEYHLSMSEVSSGYYMSLSEGEEDDGEESGYEEYLNLSDEEGLAAIID